MPVRIALPEFYRVLATMPKGGRTITQYRVRVTRKDGSCKDHIRHSQGAVDRLLKLLGPEPWTAYTTKDPETYNCCSGWECGCGGATVREAAMARREGLPPVETIELSQRSVMRSAWEPVQ